MNKPKQSIIQPMLEPDDVSQSVTLFGEQWVGDYDIVEAFDNPVIPTTVKVLAELAQAGPVLEVAAGTGRVAIPLARTGLHVCATDASEDMVQALKARDEDSSVDAYRDVLPNISGAKLYSLIYILVNSLWYLTTAEEQQAFMQNAAQHLTKTGVLVIEMAVADPQRWMDVKTLEFPELTIVRTSKWSPVSQKLLQRFEVRKPGNTKPDIRDDLIRVIFPNELFLMAKIAGLRLRHVWSDWDRKPFDPSCRTMISVFEKAKEE